ncbi:hypothetical protein BDW75DRAFT_138481 [Aspergillus navahoensis]
MPRLWIMTGLQPLLHNTILQPCDSQRPAVRSSQVSWVHMHALVSCIILSFTVRPETLDSWLQVTDLGRAQRLEWEFALLLLLSPSHIGCFENGARL